MNLGFLDTSVLPIVKKLNVDFSFFQKRFQMSLMLIKKMFESKF